MKSIASSVWKWERTITSPSRSAPRADRARGGGSATHASPATAAKATSAARIRFGRLDARYGPARVDPQDGVAMPLSSGEFRLLSALLERPKLALTRNQLLDLTKGRTPTFSTVRSTIISAACARRSNRTQEPAIHQNGVGRRLHLRRGACHGMRPWPRTLGMQLVIVTSVAVILSSVGVALWFQRGNERLSETALTERLLDRAASVATLMTSIPPKAREAATLALDSRSCISKSRREKRRPAHERRGDKAGRQAERNATAQAGESAGHGAFPANRSLRRYGTWRATRSKSCAAESTAVVMTMPVVRNTQLVATFIRPPMAPGLLKS